MEALRFLTDFTLFGALRSGCLIKGTEPIREVVLLFESGASQMEKVMAGMSYTIAGPAAGTSFASSSS